MRNGAGRCATSCRKRGSASCKRRIEHRTQMRTPSDSYNRSKKNASIGSFPFGERHFRRSVHEFVAHYHLERNHQWLGKELIDRVAAITVGEICLRTHLYSLL